jgi:CHAT domain-containing protein/tetratricopeptide (TPR) repeat protein
MRSHCIRLKSLAFLLVACSVSGCGNQPAPVSKGQRVATAPVPLSKPYPGKKGVNWLAGEWDDDECADFAAEGSLHLEFGGDVLFSRMVTHELLARLPESSDQDAHKIIVVVAEFIRRFYSLGETTAAHGFIKDLNQKVASRWGDGVEKALCQAVEGEILRADGDLNEAEKLLEAAAKVQQESENAHGLISTYASLGQLYYSMGEDAKALAALQQAELIQFSSDPRRIEVLTTLAEISISKGELQDAKALLLQAREIKPSDHIFLKSSFWQSNTLPSQWSEGNNKSSLAPMPGFRPDNPMGEGFPGGFGAELGPGFSSQGGSPYKGRSPFDTPPRSSVPLGSSAERAGYGHWGPRDSMEPPWKISNPGPVPGSSNFSRSSSVDQIRARIRYRQRIEQTWGRPRGSSLARKAMDFSAGPDLEFQRNVIWIDIRLGQVYAALGETENAIDHLLTAINKIREQAPGKVSLEHAFALNELGRVLLNSGRLEAAAKIFEEAMSASPIGHPIRSQSLHNTGRLRYAQGRIEEAIKLLEEAFEGELIRTTELLPYLSEAQAMNYVAANVQQRDPFLYVLRGSSEPNDLLRAYSAVWRTRALATRAMVATRNWGKGDPRAQELAIQLIEIRQRLASLTHGSNKNLDLDRQIAALTANKERLEKQLGELRVAANQASVDAANRKSTLDAWATSSTDPVVVELWTQLKSARQDLTTITSSSNPEPDAVERSASLTPTTEKLEKQLAELRIAEERSAAEIGRRRPEASAQPTPATIAKDTPEPQYEEFLSLMRRLPLGVAIVDLVECDARDLVANQHSEPAQDNDNRIFYAFVLRKTNEHGHYHAAWTNLGPARPIGESIMLWRRELGRPPREIRKLEGDAETAPDPLLSAGLKVRQLVWEKIEGQLGECRTVIVIPDRELTQVPWMALPGSQPNSYLLDEYAIGVATYGQQLHQLLRAGASPATPDGRMVLVGGVDYDQKTEEDEGIPNQAEARAAPRLRLGTSWGPLPGTQKEIQAVAELWGDLRPLTLLSGGEATKTRVWKELSKSQYVHLATHGFFEDPGEGATGSESAANDYILNLGSLAPANWASPSVRNPLLLSGIVLSGANEAVTELNSGRNTTSNAILTAEETADLDLNATQLVVLSACETGIGKVAGGEGVFSLQRAFHMAGARTVIGSLWSVDDRATELLMTEFYRNLWQRKLGRLEALRQAQISLRTQVDSNMLRTRGQGSATTVEPSRLKVGGQIEMPEPLPPYYWAAFVLSGDWR